MALLICSVIISLLVQEGKDLPALLVNVTFMFNLWPGGRHAFEIYSMARNEILKSYFEDIWSWVDMLSFAGIMAVCLLSGTNSDGDSSMKEQFQRVTALAVFFIWFEFLGTVFVSPNYFLPA